MKKYLVGGLVLVALCVCSFLILAPAAPGSDLSLGDIMEGMLMVGACTTIFVLVISWILGGCSLG